MLFIPYTLKLYIQINHLYFSGYSFEALDQTKEEKVWGKYGEKKLVQKWKESKNRKKMSKLHENYAFFCTNTNTST